MLNVTQAFQQATVVPDQFRFAVTNTATVWANWTAFTATSTNTAAVWRQWVTADAGTGSTSYTVVEQVRLRPPSAEQLAAARARHEQYERDRATERDRREQARQRAAACLRQHLTAGQQADLVVHGWFDVTVPSGRRYRIRRGTAGNVALLDVHDVQEATYCSHPAGDYPEEDVMLAQLLWLRTDEDEFRRNANETRWNQRVA